MVTENVYLIAILCSALLIIALLICSIRLIKRLKDSPYAIITVIFAFIEGLTYFISINPILFSANIALVARKISNLIIGLIIFFGYLYFDTLLTIKPPYSRFMLFFGVLVCDGVFVILNLTTVVDANYFFYLSGFITYSLGSLCIIFAFYVTGKTFRVIKHKGLIFDSVALFLGLLATIVLEIVLFLLISSQIDETSELGINLFWTANILFIFTLVILALNSILNGDYIYFIPIPIHLILLYNKGGLLQYSCKFKNHNLESIEKIDTLISGVFMAISTFIKEFLGKKSKLSYINAETYEIFLSPLPKEEGSIVVISSGANLIMKKSLKHFTDAIPNTIASALNDMARTHEVSYYEKILNPLIKQYFPYLLLKNE